MLEAESDISVDGGGDADVGVAHQLLGNEANALSQKQGRGRMP